MLHLMASTSTSNPRTVDAPYTYWPLHQMHHAYMHHAMIAQMSAPAAHMSGGDIEGKTDIPHNYLKSVQIAASGAVKSMWVPTTYSDCPICLICHKCSQVSVWIRVFSSWRRVARFPYWGQLAWIMAAVAWSMRGSAQWDPGS